MSMKKPAALAPLLIALLGSALTAWATWNMGRQIENEARHSLQAQALMLQNAVESRLRSYEDLLYGVAALYRAAGSVSSERFEAYAKELDIAHRFPALGSLNYAEYVQDANRETFTEGFLAEALQEGRSASLQLMPLAQEHMVLTRSHPIGSARLGFDLMNNLQKAMQLQNPIKLAQLYTPNEVVSTGMPLRPPGKSHFALAARLGVFAPDGLGSQRLIGTAGIGFNLEKFFNRIGLPVMLKHAALQVDSIGRDDGTLYSQSVRVFSKASDRPRGPWFASSTRYSTDFMVSFGGALLRVQVEEEAAALTSQRDALLPAFVFLVGMLLTALATVQSLKMINRNRELQEAVSQRIRELQRKKERTRELERELAHIAEEERRRIGNELHDDLGQRLTGMSLSSKALTAMLQELAPDLAQQAALIEQEASRAIASVRGLAHGLMPVPQGPQGLREALEELALQVSSLNGIACVFDFDDPVDIEDPNVALNLYRIAQEALNNAVRHARASKVTIRLDDENGKVVLTVSDDGIGFDQFRDTASQPAFSSGAGLRIMAYRASVINYALKVECPAESGTIIKVQEC